MRSDFGLLQRLLHCRAARDFALSSGCEQMVTEPHIDRGALDIMMKHVSDVVGVRVGSQLKPQINYIFENAVKVVATDVEFSHNDGCGYGCGFWIPATAVAIVTSLKIKFANT